MLSIGNTLPVSVVIDEAHSSSTLGSQEVAQSYMLKRRHDSVARYHWVLAQARSSAPLDVGVAAVLPRDQ